MTFYAYGFNHETAPVAAREACSFDEEGCRTFYRGLSLSEQAECILLSTCNRTEAYLFGTEDDVERVRAAFQAHAAASWETVEAFLYEDEEAIRHVLEVACGLRSQVLGDGQILNQVKEAYGLAVEENSVESVLHRLMHTAFRTAKRVITETALTDGLVSVASAAVKTARHHFEETLGIPFTAQHVLVVGAGEMACLAMETLRSHGVKHLAVTNRTAPRAVELAARFGGKHIPWERRHEAIEEATLVVVATGASEPVLHAERLPSQPSTEARTLLLDIALPRNIDPAADALSGYQVIDLDRIDQRLEEAEARRKEEVPLARAICQESLHEFVTWIFHQQAMQPAIHAIRDTFELIRKQEIDRHHHRFTDADRRELDHITRSIMQKLLAVPVVRLKSVDPESIDYVRGIRLLYTLFSHPDCEDFPQQEEGAPEGDETARTTIHSPAPCPFDTHDSESEAFPLSLLRAALRDSISPQGDSDAADSDVRY